MTETRVAVVIPTIGRDSLRVLLASLDASVGPRPDQVIVVDDRRIVGPSLFADGDVPRGLRPRVTVRRSGGRGPAAARNLGWRSADAAWIAFLDDDVVVPRNWLADLATDLGAAPADVAGVQGRLTVPLTESRRPTDAERATAGLQDARWITADMAYRRVVLATLGGFDERFPRAYREDADLALRVLGTSARLVVGRRAVTHPVRPQRWDASVRAQQGNADDALMRRRHGGDWRVRAGASAGRRRRHLAVTAAGAAGVGLAIAGRHRAAAIAGTVWAAGTAEFAAARIAPGPRDVGEVTRMVVTSALIPPAAVWHKARGTVRHRNAGAWMPRPVEAVLVDRDGTLVHDVPYNADPKQVRPLTGARPALDRLRAGGLPIGVVPNHSGVARGVITADALAAVNRRVDELLGPFETWQVCPHAPGAGCDCRKPRPGLVHAAAAALDVPAERCVVIGDIGADLQAAAAAGAFGVLVPTPATRPEEIASAAVVRPTLSAAVDLVLSAATP